MAKEVTRYIKPAVERELWARAAGRCEFQGHNELLYKSPVTQEKVNISEMAHIYSFAEDGPRGWGPFVTNKKELNKLPNLLLVCHSCHQTIDQDKEGARYSAALLNAWKQQHERRVRVVTGISPNKRSHAVIYGGKIGTENSAFCADTAIEAMFPDWYPAEELPINLSMSCEHEDDSDAFWQTESRHLQAVFERQIAPRIKENNPNHFSVFALANQPLLMLLGALLTDKVPAEIYQLHREPSNWKWQNHPDGFDYRIIRPESTKHSPVLIISLSGRITQDRVSAVVPEAISVWELTVDTCHNDFLKSQAQLSMFRQTVRKLIVEIHNAHGQSTQLRIFPAMPVACAVELGRVRMPKADAPWIIYDQNNKHNKFIPALTIGA